jgi:hypothetical protein
MRVLDWFAGYGLKTLNALAIACCMGLTSFAAQAQTISATQAPIPDDIWQAMQGVSWHAEFDTTKCEKPEACVCPPRDSLVLLSLPYRDFDDREQMGQLIVAKSVASEVADAFSEIYASGAFRIAGMELVDRYDGSDDASMAANNTSAFNCRLTTSGSRLSAHALGTAIDINPVQNPYVSGNTVLPPAGDNFDEMSERTDAPPGVIVEGDIVTEAFAKQGWVWGGNWTSLKDYQHFSRDGG